MFVSEIIQQKIRENHSISLFKKLNIMKASVISTLNVLFTLVLFSQFAYTQTSVLKNANHNDKALALVKVENNQLSENTVANCTTNTTAFGLMK